MFTAVALADLASPEMLYAKLGCKLAVGMPFKDIASSDTLLMRELPAQDADSARQALRRLQEVGMHIVTPLEHLAGNPMPGVIPLVPLADAATATRPEGATR